MTKIEAFDTPPILFVRDGLAALTQQIEFAALPREVVTETKRIVLDTLACAFGGLNEGATKAVRAMVAELGGAPEATVIGTPAKTSCTLATFANGTALRYLDTNDYYFGRDPAHASGNLAPVLAVGERMKSSGARGPCRFCRRLRGSIPALRLRRQSEPVGSRLASRHQYVVCQRRRGGQADAARPYGQIAEALAIAGTHGNILTESMRGKMASIKATIEAVAAKGGVEAALMAAHGLTGPQTIFEGDYGWARLSPGDRRGCADRADVDGHVHDHENADQTVSGLRAGQGLFTPRSKSTASIARRSRTSPRSRAASRNRFSNGRPRTIKKPCRAIAKWRTTARFI